MSRLPLLMLALPLLAATAAASAATDSSLPCGKRDELFGHLSGKYNEKPVAMGLATNGTVVEVLASHAGDSFTIVYTTPNGLTCMMAAGRNWETVKQPSDDLKT